MSANSQAALLALSSLWFIVYWILGGVVFSIIAATKSIHMKKARFSCLFTLGAVAAAFGAAYTGILMARPLGIRCPDIFIERGTLFGAERLSVQTLLMCDVNAALRAGGVFFVFLIIIGAVALLFSRIERTR